MSIPAILLKPILSGSLEALLRHELDQVGATSRVAPLIIVPADNLDHIATNHVARIGIDDAGTRVTPKVHRNQGLFGDTQDTFHRTRRGCVKGCDQLISSQFPVNGRNKVHNRDRRRGNAHGHAIKLALQIWNYQRDGFGSTRRCRDDIEGCGTGPARLAMRAIHQILIVRVRVNSGHVAFFNTPVVMDNLGRRRQAISRTRGIGDNIVLIWIIVGIVHAENDGDILVGSGSADNDLFGTRLEMRSSILTISEKAC